MCLLIISEKNFPSNEVLRIGSEQNQHGAGIAWIEGEGENTKVKWKKGIDLNELLTFKDKVDGKPHLIHFRLSTVGGRKDELCHPFAINAEASCSLEGEADAVLAHNGTWTGYSRELLLTLSNEIRMPSGFWSDTRAMAWLAYMKGDAKAKFLSSISEKVAVLNKTGVIDVFNKSMFHEHEGLLLSYNPFTRTTKGSKTTTVYGGNTSVSTNTSSKNFDYDDWASARNPVTGGFKTGGMFGKSLPLTYPGMKKFAGKELPLPFDI